MRPGYKRTENRVIAQEWGAKRFGEIASLRKERIYPQRDSDCGFCVELEHVEPATGRLIGDTSMGPQVSMKSVFRAGDVLFGKLRAYLRKYWLADRDGVCSTEFWVLSANHQCITPEYLFHLVTTQEFIEMASMAYGTHMPRSDWNVVKHYELSLPEVDEQHMIATALSDVDALISSLDKLIAKKRDIKQAAMQQLLTGRRRLPGFSDVWGVGELCDVADVMMGQSPPGSSYNLRGIGMPLINGPTEFTDTHPVAIQWTSAPTRLCRPGDLLLCVRGSSTGRTNIADDDYCIGRGVAAIRAKPGNDNAFVAYQVESSVADILAVTTGSTFPNIDGKTLRELRIRTAGLPEQVAIASVLSDMDGEIEALERRRDKTRLLKQGMMQELLTGRVRLV